MSFLDQLNPQQREAVETTDGPVLILAGAGSGIGLKLVTQVVERTIDVRLRESAHTCNISGQPALQ